jgi:hypothetical protein
MLTSISELEQDAGSLADPKRIGELLPEVLARYGFASGLNAVIHPAHANVGRRHPGPARNASEKRERKENTVRMPGARQLSAAG